MNTKQFNLIEELDNLTPVALAELYVHLSGLPALNSTTGNILLGNIEKAVKAAGYANCGKQDFWEEVEYKADEYGEDE